MGRMRKRYTERFKRKVAIEAVREKKTVAEITAESGVSPSLVTEWKQRFINGEDSREVRLLEIFLSRLQRKGTFSRRSTGRWPWRTSC